MTLATPLKYSRIHSLSKQNAYSSSAVLKIGILPSVLSNGTIFLDTDLVNVFFTGDFVLVLGGSNLKPFAKLYYAFAKV